MPTKSRLRTIAWHIRRNYTHKIRLLLGDSASAHGATHLDLSLERSLQYIDEVFTDYLSYSGLSEDDFEGRRLLEIGPGDNLGVAAKFLAAGCSQVVCLDRFTAQQDQAQQSRIYKALRGTLSEGGRQRFDDALCLDGEVRLNPSRLQYLTGYALERVPKDLLEPESFDYIVSRAVLMELRDSDAGFATMHRLLKPGGTMIHKLAPLHDYQMFQAYGYSPLEFLTIPRWLYRHMVSDCGGPNRMPLSYYRRKAAELGYDSAIHIVNLVGSALKFPPGVKTVPSELPEYRRAEDVVTEIRCRLAADFEKLGDDDLVIEDIFLVARKPESRTVTAGTAEPAAYARTR